jgi:Ca2+-transporting ATPase
MDKYEQHETIFHKGLSASEVEASRQQHGSNVLTPPQREPWWKLFLAKFDDPVIRILMIAAGLAILAGIAESHYTEGLGIIVAVLLATTLAFLNEYKASKEFDLLSKVTDDVPVKVLRDGGFTEVPRKDLVVGDLVHVEVGEETPADGSVVEAVLLQIDESRLTGESNPVTKFTAEQAAKLPPHDTAYAADRVLRGTMVVDGYGMLELTAVGDSTEIGQTARAAAEESGEPTPLNAQLERLSKLIGVVGLAVAVAIYAALVVRGVAMVELSLTAGQWCFFALLVTTVAVVLVRVWLPIVYDGLEFLGSSLEPPAWLETDNVRGWVINLLLGGAVMAVGVAIGWPAGLLPKSVPDWLPADAAEEFLAYFMIAVTIIVVAVPEGLAMSVTLSLAYSMRKMTATNNLVRRMHACETIGAATVICSDKTGTLTRNQMKVSEVNFPSLTRPLTSDGKPTTAERLVVEAIAVNTTAHLSRVPGEPVASLGNPTEGALLLWLDECGFDYIHRRTHFDINYQWTFTTERKYMGTLGVSPVLDKRVLHLKGAPEIVLQRCASVRTADGVQPLNPSIVSKIEEELAQYQARGMRTLAFACHEITGNHEETSIEEVATDLTWLGFVAIADPVRPEVPSAIRACRDAGVRVMMVTGDNPSTSREIARQIDLWTDGDAEKQHLTGDQFGKLDDDQAREAVAELKILSRARPLDKLRLVRLLQQRGHVVAVTGDGINDAPALNHANVGLAMGRTGTAVAKEAADIILLDDSFRSIVNAIMWGRSLYENIQRFVQFQLTINVSALCTALLGPFLGVKFPFTVIQMLWVNLIMDTFAALALATEPPHSAVMQRPPRDPADFIVTKSMTKNIFGVAAIFLVLLVGMLLYFQQHGGIDDSEPSQAGTVFFTVFVMLQFWNLFNARCLGTSRSGLAGLLDNKWFLAIAAAIFLGQVAIVQFGGQVFRTEPLSLRDWLLITAATSLVLIGGECIRFVRRLATSA